MTGAETGGAAQTGEPSEHGSPQAPRRATTPPGASPCGAGPGLAGVWSVAGGLLLGVGSGDVWAKWTRTRAKGLWHVPPALDFSGADKHDPWPRGASPCRRGVGCIGSGMPHDKPPGAFKGRRVRPAAIPSPH